MRLFFINWDMASSRSALQTKKLHLGSPGMSSQPSGVITWNLAMLTLIMGIGGTFQYGLHISIINSPAKYIQSFINQTWEERTGSHFSQKTLTFLWSFIVSVYSVGGILGALVTGHLVVRFGRKRTMLYNNLVAVLGAILMAVSRTVGSFEVVVLGRIFYGFNAGVGLMVHNMYIGECAPQKLRGMITVTISIFIGIGKLAGLALGLSEFLGSEATWPLLMASSAVPALLQLVTLPFFPDSPRYLLIDMQDKEGCIKAMHQLWGGADHTAEMEDMVAELNLIKGKKSKSTLDLLRDRSVRWQLIVILLVTGCIQFIGINAVYFYAYEVFQNAGIPLAETRYVSLGLALIEIFTVVLCAFVIDRIGRKTLLWVNYAVIAMAMGLLTATLTLQDAYPWIPYVSTFLIFVVILSFGVGPGSVSCPLNTELFVQTHRPAAFTLIGGLNWAGLFVLAAGFPLLVEGLGTYCFLFFLVYCLFMAVFIWLVMPETKQKTILEIMESFHQLNFGRQKEAKDLGTDNLSVLTTKL